MTERSHFVYRAMDADGVVLYIGCTRSPESRYRGHMGGTSEYAFRGIWFDPFVHRWAVTGPLPRDKALALEKSEIETLDPIFNGTKPWTRRWPRVAAYYAERGRAYPTRERHVSS